MASTRSALRYLVPSLTVCAGLAAADVTPTPGPTMGNPSKGLLDRLAGNNQYLIGHLQIEGINQNNFTDADDDENDRFSNMLIRAELGAQLEFDETLEAQLAIGYDAEGGDETFAGQPGDNSGDVFMEDAFLTFKRFLWPELSMRLGRQPVNWNLRLDRGGFLFDSRENNRQVRSWDGIDIRYDFENVSVFPFMYILDEDRDALGNSGGSGVESRDNSLYGLYLTWEPEQIDASSMYLVGGYTIEINPVVDRNHGLRPTRVGNDLRTWYVGAEYDLRRQNGWDFYGEFAGQEGDFQDGRDFAGLAVIGGAGYTFDLWGARKARIGLQYDRNTGTGKDSGDYDGIVRTHEGQSDTYIVEHERYGELAEAASNQLTAYKYFFDWSLDQTERIKLSFVVAQYEVSEPAPGMSDDFGREYDLTLAWQYNDFTTITLWGAWFDDNVGFRQIAGINSTNDDEILEFGASIMALF